MYSDTSLCTENSEVGNQKYREEMKLKGKGAEGRGGKGRMGRGSQGMSRAGAGVGRLWPVGAVYLDEV